MAARIEQLTTSGTFSLDGQTWDVDNNVWIVGDENEAVVIDAAHDSHGIAAAVAGRNVIAILCTHSHDDHIDVAPEISDFVDAPVLAHPADAPLWGMAHPHRLPDGDLSDGQIIDVAGISLRVLHTPGHSPGSCCFYSPDLGAVFTGDTLFKGGPGATGRSFSDFPTIIESISKRLLTLPANTQVRTGHGESTTIGAEAPDLDAWVLRGH